MIAAAALFLWPLVAIMLYRRFELPVALCATILGGYLLLPSAIQFDLPVLPALHRDSIPALSALVLTLVVLRGSTETVPAPHGWIPRNPVVLGLLMLLVFGAFGSVWTNGDYLVFGDRVLQGLVLYDALSVLLELGVLLIPFFLARRILASPRGMWILLVALAVSALAYSLPALWEVRMSPQLHSTVYGYFPHQFLQHMRGGGFRPLVFMNHGLTLGIFLTFGILAAAGLFRISRGEARLKWGLAAIWLLGTLVLAKSLGALLIVLVLLPVVLLLGIRLQLLAAACIAGIILVYPVARAAHVIPIDHIMSFAESISPERAWSLQVRIENEESLLARAQERPLFGWGGWGRNRIFDEEGRNLSTTDGSWVIELGNGGWFRYLGIFGLMCWPVIGLFLARRDKIDPACAILALIVCAKLVDLIPNSGFPSVIWLAAGALAGRLEMRAGDWATEGQSTAEQPARKSRHAQALPAGPRFARTFKRQDEAPELQEDSAAAPDKPRRRTTYRRSSSAPRYSR